MYTREQVHESTLKYFNGDELATTTWIDKYCLKDGEILYELNPDWMHRRLSKEFARIELKYPNPMDEEEIYQLLKDFKYIIPQGSPMHGIGNNFAITSISNCLVIGGHVDSYGGIMKADEEQAQLMKRRCGVGQDISWIRPSGAIAGASALGPNAGTVLYMDRFSGTTKEVQQDGRRGALMLTISMKHPDAEKFIDKKTVEGAVTGANVSVKVTNEFMKHVKSGKPYLQTFPIGISAEEILNHPEGIKGEYVDTETLIESLELDRLYDGAVVGGRQTYFKVVDSIRLWEKIVYNAWKNAEPGILFWDNVIEESPARGYGLEWREASTNPCGEIPLPKDDSCRLLLLNLYSYVYEAFTKEAMLEDRLLIHHIKMAMRLMDDIVDLEIEKIDQILDDIDSKTYDKKFQQVERELWEKIRQKAVDGRRTGLGITGEADLLAAMGLKYGTPEATRFAEVLHQLFATTAYEASIELAEERGAFPIWDKNKDAESKFLKRMFYDNEMMYDELEERYLETGRRNIGILTIAPAGSVSLLAQTSSGIEPVFSIWHFRKKKVQSNVKYDWKDDDGDYWVEYPVFHRPFIQWYAISNDITFEKAEKFLGECNEDTLTKYFEKSPYFEATALDVDYVEKVKMQGAVQKWVDHSISVTVNMPEDVTEKMVADVYLEAFKSGCKGITVYRNNSRGNVLSTESIKKIDLSEDFDYVAAHKRPRSVKCDIYFKSAGKKPFIFMVGTIEGKPYEMFGIPYNDKTKFSKTIKNGIITKAGRGKYILTGEDDVILIESITDHMVETEQNETRSISALLRHRSHPRWIKKSIIEKYATINSFHKVAAKVLGEYIENENNECPKCEGEMQMTEGCMKCPDCGYSHCG